MRKERFQKPNKKDLFGKANYDGQIVTFIKIAVVVLLVLGLVYLATALATGEIKLGSSKSKDTEETAIQYEEIIAGQIMNRQDEEYYVLVFNFTDVEASYYLSLKDSYSQNADSLSFYIVDLEKGFNQILIPEEGEDYKQNPTTIQDLKVEAPTILKIKNSKVVERITSSEKVKEYLEKIA